MSFAYYQSPTDGNVYPAYTLNSFNMPTPLFFAMNSGHQLALYFNDNGTFGLNINSILFSPNTLPNGFLNIGYFQPQMYGATSLLHCQQYPNEAVQLLFKDNNNLFTPFQIRNTSPITASDPFELTISPSTPAPPPPLKNHTELPNQVNQALSGFMSGSLSKVSIDLQDDRFSLNGYDSSGNSINITKTPNVTQRTEVSGATSVSERRQIVKELRLEKNMSQTEIAKYLQVSQKTVSNDIAALGIK